MNTNKPVELRNGARQSSEFAPDIEGMDTKSINGGAAVAHAQPDDADLCIWETDCVFVACAVACGRHEHHSQMRHREITPPPPSDRLHPSQPDSARLDIGWTCCFPVTISAKETRGMSVKKNCKCIFKICSFLLVRDFATNFCSEIPGRPQSSIIFSELNFYQE